MKEIVDLRLRGGETYNSDPWAHLRVCQMIFDQHCVEAASLRMVELKIIAGTTWKGNTKRCCMREARRGT